jgi:hypothetical protein
VTNVTNVRRSSRAARRRFAFAVIAFTSAVSLLAVAQPRKPAIRPAAPPASGAPTAPGKKPGARPDEREAGAGPLATPLATPIVTRDERSAPASVGAGRDAGTGGGAVLEARTVGDAGARVFRFGEVEVEGRLKSPQIVYFLRRVRAEFAAGDLGHRTFLREMSETGREPGF